MISAASVVVVIAYALAGDAAQPESIDALLDRVAQAAKPADAVMSAWDYTMTVNTEELDGDGKTASTELLEIRHTRVGKASHDEIVRHLRDGKDVTGDDKKTKDAVQSASGDSDTGDVGFGSPFDDAERKNYTFTLLAPDADGHARVRFAPKKAGDETMTGSAVVDAQRARMLSCHMRPTSLPMLVSSMDIKMTWGDVPNVGAVVDKLVVEGEVGVAFVKKRFRATTSFSKWTPPAR